MALVVCPDCLAQMSDAAPACLRCGRPTMTQAQPFAGSARAPTQPSAGQSIGSIVLVLFLGWGGYSFYSCYSAVTAPTAAKVTPAPRAAADADANDAMRAIVSAYPVACAAQKAESAWAKCHDKTKGYDAVLKCARDCASIATDAATRLPARIAKLPCGTTIEQSCAGVVTTSATFFPEVVAWLEKSKAKLSPKLSGKSLYEACGDAEGLCDDEPEESSEKYQALGWGNVMGVDCTKALFQCGIDKENVCWINKVADRLGASCEPAEVKTSPQPADVLYARRTGHRMTP